MYARLKCCMHNVCAVCMGYASIMHENAYHMHTPCIPHAYCNNLLHNEKGNCINVLKIPMM